MERSSRIDEMESEVNWIWILKWIHLLYSNANQLISDRLLPQNNRINQIESNEMFHLRLEIKTTTTKNRTI